MLVADSRPSGAPSNTVFHFGPVAKGEQAKNCNVAMEAWHDLNMLSIQIEEVPTFWFWTQAA